MTSLIIASIVAPIVLPIVLMLGIIARELRLIRMRLGGRLSFFPWRED